MVSGRTKVLCVIGAPIAHSLSPLMQNAALRAAGLDYVYIALPIRPQALHSAVRGLCDAGICGFNVTIPFKTAILDLMDVLDEDARRIRAVNTVVVEPDGTLVGYNTDVCGFLAALTKRGIVLDRKQVVLLGAGGAARAALWGVLKQGAKKVSIGVRNPMKGMLLCEDFAADGDVQAFHFSDAVFSERLHAADLIIQTTPMGMAPHIQEMPPIDWSVVNPKAVAYDLIYTPMKTRFLREAEQHGLSVVNGEDMLIAQGAEAFYLWTGVRPDVEVMTRMLREELRRRG